MKIIFPLLTAFGIELALFLFGGGTYANSSLFGMIYNPASIFTNQLYITIVAMIAVSIGAAIIIGNFYQVSNLGVYATLAAVLITFISTIIHLSSFINGQLTEIGIDSAGVITAIIIAPFLLGYLISVIEWMRWN